MNARITCICGKKTKVSNGRKVNCPNCGALLKMDGVIPIVRIPEDSIQERKANGKPVMLRRPVGRWGWGQ